MSTVPDLQVSLSTTHSLPMACTSSFCLLRTTSSAFSIKLLFLPRSLPLAPDSPSLPGRAVASPLCCVVPCTTSIRLLATCLTTWWMSVACFTWASWPVNAVFLFVFPVRYLVPGRCFKKGSACLLLFCWMVDFLWTSWIPGFTASSSKSFPSCL